MKGRKNGCPANIRNWIVRVKNPDDTDWTRVYGLTKMTRTVEGDTEDGSSDIDDWAEPYVTKRSASIKLEGDSIVDEATGAVDPGQALLSSYAEAVGCSGDLNVWLIDPWGRSVKFDVVVTSHETNAEDTDNTESWDMDQVGAPEVVPYIQVGSIALKDGDNALTTLTADVGDAATLVTVAFTPTNASNQRFRVSNTNRMVATVSDVTEGGFSITPVSAGTATIRVVSINGAKVATVTVTVTDT